MKKIMFSFIFLLPLFLFLPKVSADTINITLPEGWTSFVENSLPTIQQEAVDYYTQWPTLVNSDYYVYCNHSLTTCYTRHIRVAQVSNISNINYTGSYNSNNFLITLNTSRTYVISNYGFSNNNFDTQSCNSNNCPDSVSFIYYWPGYDNSTFIPLYSTINIGTSNINSHTYIFTYDNWSYTLESGFTSFPTLYDLYEDYNSTPPIPEDETPLLTSFYTLAIDRISYLLEEFSSNYLYLSIFCIFLFVLIIYFIHRRLKL